MYNFYNSSVSTLSEMKETDCVGTLYVNKVHPLVKAKRTESENGLVSIQEMESCAGMTSNER
jgi:hypothetical protein